MVFAKLMAEVVEEMRAEGHRQARRGLACRRRQVEEAAEYLYQHGILAYAYSTEMPVAGARREVQVGPRRGTAVSQAAGSARP